jgi:hypothetical protein
MMGNCQHGQGGCLLAEPKCLASWNRILEKHQRIQRASLNSA